MWARLVSQCCVNNDICRWKNHFLTKIWDSENLERIQWILFTKPYLLVIRSNLKKPNNFRHYFHNWVFVIALSTQRTVNEDPIPKTEKKMFDSFCLDWVTWDIKGWDMLIEKQSTIIKLIFCILKIVPVKQMCSMVFGFFQCAVRRNSMQIHGLAKLFFSAHLKDDWIRERSLETGFFTVHYSYRRTRYEI